MGYLDNYLTNEHFFSNENHLHKFRFTLLNGLTHFIAFFITLYYFTALFGFIELTPYFEKAMFVYMLVNFISLWLLKKSKEYYALVSNITIITATLLFYIALIQMINDEFRMVWFLIVVFVAFILKGQRYGITLMFIILFSVLITFLYFDLQLSNLAIYTFFNSFFVFSSFSFFFLGKIEKDEKEFSRLHLKLSKKISTEIKYRKEQEKLLLQQCRLASMGEMIDSIAHQWRQPLMNINAILLNMERGIEIKENPKEYLENKMDEVITLTTHMSQTIEDFRSLLKVDKQKVHFFIGKSISHALELCEGLLQNIDIQVTPTDKLSFYGYNNELIQVLITILSNAIDILNVRKIKSKQIIIDIKINTQLYISIEDNAGGIEGKYLEKIFDPYFTTKENSGGTGLGLYIAKIIIEQNMSGTLHVLNTDKGAKFEISVPSC